MQDKHQRQQSIQPHLLALGVRPMVRAWRRSKGLPADPLSALRPSGYVEQVSAERAVSNAKAGSSYAWLVSLSEEL